MRTTSPLGHGSYRGAAGPRGKLSVWKRLRQAWVVVDTGQDERRRAGTQKHPRATLPACAFEMRGRCAPEPPPPASSMRAPRAERVREDRPPSLAVGENPRESGSL